MFRAAAPYSKIKMSKCCAAYEADILTWMNRRGFWGCLLCSECEIPVPAVINWMLPLPRVSSVPIESLCESSP